MAIKYLYIDDNFGHVVEGQVSGLNLNKDELEVVHRQPFGNWEAERKYFIDDFSNQYDGLILDLRLDDEKNEAGKKAFYKGTSLAQELRTLSTEKAIKETPIILLSANEKMVESLDTTGEDLFDIRIPKERLEGSYFQDLRGRLIGLGKGYRQLSELKGASSSSKWFAELFKVKEESIDSRFVLKALTFYGQPAHSFVSFVIKSLLASDGILIAEWTLAARLGVDMKKSDDWQKLLSLFDSALYRGVFNEGWRRWWSTEFDTIISKWFPEDFLARNVDAKKRVEIIRKASSLEKIQAAELAPYSQSSAFWTICRGSGRPIDPVDGLIIANQENLYPWQERKYVSIDEALHRRQVAFWKEVASSEIDRLKRLQILHARDRNK